MEFLNLCSIRKGIQFLLIVFVSLLLFACQGEEDKKTYTTVGVVNLSPVLEPIFGGFKEGMKEFGYVEGESITYIYQGATGDIDALNEAVQGVIDGGADIILSLSTPATVAAKAVIADAGIPVIFVPVTDPVGADLVDSLIHPGGDITGITIGMQERRRLEWLTRIAPDIEQIYIPYNPDDPSPVGALASIEETAVKLGVTLLPIEVRTEDEVVQAISNIPTDADAIMLLPDSFLSLHTDKIVEAANEKKIPLTVPSDVQVEAGALMAYSFRFAESGKQAARLADQILTGISPSDLPVETAEFFLVINMDAANNIGLKIPNDVLQQADTIIR